MIVRGQVQSGRDSKPERDLDSELKPISPAAGTFVAHNAIARLEYPVKLRLRYAMTFATNAKRT